MPLTQPTRAEILEQIKADMRIELGSDPLRRSPEYALARAEMGQSKNQYSFLAKIFRQCFADSADAEYFWRWARIFGIDQKAPTPWQGIVLFTGVDGTVIPALTQIVRSDGATYETDVEHEIGEDVSGEIEIACTAIADDYGTEANNDDGQPLSIVTPILDVDNECTVVETTNAGEDIEDPEDGLVRLLEHLRTPPSGGGPGDYIRWALEVPGVTRAWEFANLEAPNSVSVAFVRDDDGVGAAIIPDAGERGDVLDYLQTKAPITVDVRVITLTALTVNVEVSDLEPDTVAVLNAIEVSLQDMFIREAEPGITIALSRFSSAISNATGEISHVLDLPAAPVVATTAQIPILGTVTAV
jgi:uncharacterized phage protein gp47/JayE